MEDIELFYLEIGADFNDVKGRFKENERIIKFLRLFFKENSFNELFKMFEKQDIKEAFRYSHTLKGMTRELSLTNLNIIFIKLTDLLRDGNVKDTLAVEDMLIKAKIEYSKTLESFSNNVGIE